jgi:hypothetical protein
MIFGSQFEKSGYYMIGILGLIFLGFWPSYFSKFFDGTADFTIYFHFHATIALIWLGLLILQPVLIKKKKFALHRLIGKFSFLIMPLLFLSVLLLAHSRIPTKEVDVAMDLIFPFKDLVILTFAFGVAILYRKDVAIHARGMIATGIVFVEPSLVRFMMRQFSDTTGYIVTILIVDLLLIGLILGERKARKGRWVFPVVLLLYILVQIVLVFNIKFSLWEIFVEWFSALPLT